MNQNEFEADLKREGKTDRASGKLKDVVDKVEEKAKDLIDDVKDKILGNMSQRAGDMLREEMDYLGPVKLSAVEQVQQQIVDVVRRLEDSGEITLEAGDEVEEFIQ